VKEVAAERFARNLVPNSKVPLGTAAAEAVASHDEKNLQAEHFGLAAPGGVAEVRIGIGEACLKHHEGNSRSLVAVHFQYSLQEPVPEFVGLVHEEAQRHTNSLVLELVLQQGC
jgi:hypothetical protein